MKLSGRTPVPCDRSSSSARPMIARGCSGSMSCRCKSYAATHDRGPARCRMHVGETRPAAVATTLCPRPAYDGPYHSLCSCRAGVGIAPHRMASFNGSRRGDGRSTHYCTSAGRVQTEAGRRRRHWFSYLWFHGRTRAKADETSPLIRGDEEAVERCSQPRPAMPEKCCLVIALICSA